MKRYLAKRMAAASTPILAACLFFSPFGTEAGTQEPAFAAGSGQLLHLAQYKPPPKPIRPIFNQAARPSSKQKFNDKARKRSIRRKFNDAANPSDDGGGGAGHNHTPPGPRWTPPGM